MRDLDTSTQRQKEINKKNKIIIRYKRLLIQLVIIIFAVVALLYSIFNIRDNDVLNNIIGAILGVLTGAVISVIDFLFLKKDEDEDEVERQSELVSSIKSLEKRIASSSSGISGVRIHRNRNQIDFPSLIQSSTSRIWVMNTNLNFIYTYANLIYGAAIEKFVDVKVMGLNPNNLFLYTRYHELGFDDVDDFFREILSSDKNIQRELLEKINSVSNYQVRLFYNQPTHMIFLFDDTLIVSFILRQGRARERIHIEFDLTNESVASFAKDFVDDFQLIWDEAIDIRSADFSTSYDTDAMLSTGIDGINTYKLQ